MTRKLRSFAAIALGCGALFSAPAHAAALVGDWTQVGAIAAGPGGLFGGNCNLASSCTYALDAEGDWWSAFTPQTGQKMLFVTGDREVWGIADYATLSGLVSAQSGVFAPNLSWLDAGVGGVSLGAGVTGNVLSRTSAEDPWVTLIGPHCAHTSTTAYPGADDCNLVLWGEGNFTGAIHNSLTDAAGGIEVYVGFGSVSEVPVPAALGLLGAGVAALGAAGARRRG